MVSQLFSQMQSWQLALWIVLIAVLLIADYIFRGVVVAQVAGCGKSDIWRIYVPFVYVDFRKTVAANRSASAQLQILRPDLFLLFLIAACLIVESGSFVAILVFFCSMFVYYLISVILSYHRILRDHYRIYNPVFSVLQIVPLVGSVVMLAVLTGIFRTNSMPAPVNMPQPPPSPLKESALPAGLLYSDELLERLAKEVLPPVENSAVELSSSSSDEYLSADHDYFDRMLGEDEEIRLEDLRMAPEPVSLEFPEVEIKEEPQYDSLDYYTNPIYPPRRNQNRQMPAPDSISVSAPAAASIPDYVLLDALGYLPEDV